MIQASKAGFLFKSTEQIKKDHPELPAYETYDELMAAIKKHYNLLYYYYYEKLSGQMLFC